MLTPEATCRSTEPSLNSSSSGFNEAGGFAQAGNGCVHTEVQWRCSQCHFHSAQVHTEHMTVTVHSPQRADEAVHGALGIQGYNIPDVEEAGCRVRHSAADLFQQREEPAGRAEREELSPPSCPLLSVCGSSEAAKKVKVSSSHAAAAVPRVQENLFTFTPLQSCRLQGLTGGCCCMTANCGRKTL